MSSQSTSHSLSENHNAGKIAKEGASNDTPGNHVSQSNWEQTYFPCHASHNFIDVSSLTASELESLKQRVSDEMRVDVDLSSLTTSEQKIYEELQAHGWNDEDCLYYFVNVIALRKFYSRHFRAKGWSEDRIKALNESCDSELPSYFFTTPANHYKWQMKLLEEQNRMRRIAENMEHSSSKLES